MDKFKTFVLGASGSLGYEICSLLRAGSWPVKGLVRKTTGTEKRNQLRHIGVELAEGDLSDRETLERHLKGIRTVIVTISSMPFSYIPGVNDIKTVDEDGVINAIDASKAAGVEHFIYTSFSKNINIDFPLSKAKRKVEKYLQESGLKYTILRPGYFNEAWLSPMTGFDAEGGKVNIVGTGEEPVSYISYKDVAKFAVESVTNPNSVNSILELGGPGKISRKEAVNIFENAMGRKIEVSYTPLEVLKEQFANATDPMQISFTGLIICLAKGDVIEMSEILKKFPVKLTSVKEYSQSLVK